MYRISHLQRNVKGLRILGRGKPISSTNFNRQCHLASSSISSSSWLRNETLPSDIPSSARLYSCTNILLEGSTKASFEDWNKVSIRFLISIQVFMYHLICSLKKKETANLCCKWRFEKD